MKEYLLLFAVLFVIFGIQSYRMQKDERKKLEKDITMRWGRRAERKYHHDEYKRIADYYEKTVGKEDVVVDDITWNDLSMDDIFKAMNNTYSSVGEESLYRHLRILKQDERELKTFGSMIAAFEKNTEKAKKLQECYADIGRTKGVSFYDFITVAEKLTPKSNLKHVLCILLLTAAVISLFIKPVFGVLAVFFMLCYNIFDYSKEKNNVNNYFICFEYIVGLIRHGEQVKQILKEINPKVFQTYIDEIEQLLDKTKNMKRGMFLISASGVNDSIVEMVMQYVRMIFHVDLIKFNTMVRKTSDNINSIRMLYTIIGDVEAACACASFRAYLRDAYGSYAIPEFKAGSGLMFDHIYHPLIEGAVKNSMLSEHSVLLTGSNASGKSTFLKTVAINGILSQTIYTAASDRFVMPLCEIYSSMTLRDDLSSKNSYYMAEIKALKRILDRAAQGKNVLCFIDEVLRGTNTIERIAASSEILKTLKCKNVICFAATHDMELTYILENEYANYHFEEEITKNDVKFNYHLSKGRTVTRNAIRLLKTLNYPAAIVENAEKRVTEFSATGKWQVE